MQASPSFTKYLYQYHKNLKNKEVFSTKTRFCLEKFGVEETLFQRNKYPEVGFSIVVYTGVAPGLSWNVWTLIFLLSNKNMWAGPVKMEFHERVIMFSAVRLAPEIVSKRSWFSHGLQNLKSSRGRLKTNKQAEM